MRIRPVAMILVLALGATGCGGPPAGGSSAATGAARASLGTSPTAAEPDETMPFDASVREVCGAFPPLPHQAPELERMLPSEVAGRKLTRWSMRGRCVLQSVAGNLPGGVDALIADAETPGSAPIDVDRVAQAIAGRTDTVADPPYIIFAAARPRDDDETNLNLLLLLGGAGFNDVGTAAFVAGLDGFDEREIGGKQVYVGSLEMLDQNEHQRGLPYLYETADAMFVLITELETWAEEALAEMP